MSLRGLAKAELMIQVWWLKNNRVMLVLSFVWPYTAVLVLLALGTAYGSLENLRKSLGVVDPLVYLFAGSAIAFASAGIVDNASGVAQWHRWLGTLPYVYTAPHRFPVYLVVSGLMGSLFIALTDFIAIMPAVIAVSGFLGALRMMIVLLIMLLGSLPLVGIAVAAALLSLMAREEGNVLSWLNPFILLVSGVFYPIEVLPRLLQVLGRALPVTYVVEAARIAATYQHPPGSLIMAVAYILALMILAYNTGSVVVVSRLEGKARRKGVF
ncbi:MAG: ABC transporter permease [Pyrodictiaceae archaeon]